VVQLKRFNTLRIKARVAALVPLHAGSNLDQLRRQLSYANSVYVIGGGSNLVMRDLPLATVLQVNNRGIELIEQNGSDLIVQACAGEDWHPFVMDCLARGWNGLENLSLIPGKVGASPIQNIGAYGQEVGNKIHSVQVWHWPSGKVEIWEANQCQFGYRDSVFKHEQGRDWIVLAVRFRLSTLNRTIVNYADLNQELGGNKDNATPKQVAAAVIQVRRRKLPDPDVLPNAGSFFKNPVLTQAQIDHLSALFPGIPQYPVSNGIKTSAAWLIERSGWKGKRIGDAGVDQKHALVLVNHGRATGEQMIQLANAIRRDVKQQFDVNLEPEPILW
jgi:UDP-N-acetylmuramate dehydrogenase